MPTPFVTISVLRLLKRYERKKKKAFKEFKRKTIQYNVHCYRHKKNQSSKYIEGQPSFKIVK